MPCRRHRQLYLRYIRQLLYLLYHPKGSCQAAICMPLALRCAHEVQCRVPETGWKQALVGRQHMSTTCPLKLNRAAGFLSQVAYSIVAGQPIQLRQKGKKLLKGSQDLQASAMELHNIIKQGSSKSEQHQAPPGPKHHETPSDRAPLITLKPWPDD